jgi:hypothetical protein
VSDDRGQLRESDQGADVKLEPQFLENCFDSFMRRESDIQQLRRFIEAEKDDAKAQEIAKKIARAFYSRLTQGIIK